MLGGRLKRLNFRIDIHVLNVVRLCRYNRPSRSSNLISWLLQSQPFVEWRTSPQPIGYVGSLVKNTFLKNFSPSLTVATNRTFCGRQYDFLQMIVYGVSIKTTSYRRMKLALYWPQCLNRFSSGYVENTWSIRLKWMSPEIAFLIFTVISMSAASVVLPFQSTWKYTYVLWERLLIFATILEGRKLIDLLTSTWLGFSSLKAFTHVRIFGRNGATRSRITSSKPICVYVMS